MSDPRLVETRKRDSHIFASYRKIFANRTVVLDRVITQCTSMTHTRPGPNWRILLASLTDIARGGTSTDSLTEPRAVFQVNPTFLSFREVPFLCWSKGELEGNPSIWGVPYVETNQSINFCTGMGQKHLTLLSHLAKMDDMLTSPFEMALSAGRTPPYELQSIASI